MPVDQEPRTFLWSRDQYERDQVGHALFPPHLEGRWRHPRSAQEPLPKGTQQSLRNALQRQGIETVHGLLSLNLADYDRLLKPTLKEAMDTEVLRYLETVAHGPEGLLLRAVFAADNVPTPLRVELEEARQEAVQRALASLDPRQQEVVLLRYRFVDGRFQTLEEIGKSFGVSRSRILQIEARALRRLRHPTRSYQLKPFLTFPEDSVATQLFGCNSFYDFEAQYRRLPSFSEYGPIFKFRTWPEHLAQPLAQVSPEDVAKIQTSVQGWAR